MTNRLNLYLRPSNALPFALAAAVLAVGIASPAFGKTLKTYETPSGSAQGAIQTIEKWGSAKGAKFLVSAIDLNSDAALGDGLISTQPYSH